MAPPAKTRRDRVYELLREAGKEGVTLQHFADDGIPCPNVHMESLRFEGMGIEWVPQTDPRSGRFVSRWVLVKDRWADVPEHEAQVAA